MYGEEIERVLMPFTVKGTEQNDGALRQNADVEAGDDVDILGGPKTPGHRLIEAEPVATTTESSSSFGGTDDSGDEFSDVYGDPEAITSLRGDGELSGAVFDGFGELSRMRLKRRKASSQWKSRTQPLAWRLRWAELQMKMLKEFADGYDGKLEECNKLKQIRLGRSQSAAREVAFSHVKGANRVLRRKKRKRDESSGDLAKYTLQHNLFSYYDNGRRNVPPCKVTAPKFINEDESWACGEQLFEELQRSDDSSEDKLQNIFDLCSTIIGMKSRVERILLLHDDDDDDSWMSLCAPARSSGNLAAQLVSEYSLNDDLAPEDEGAVHGTTVRPSVVRGGSVNRNSSSTQKVRSAGAITGPRSKRRMGRRSKRGGK